MQTSIMQINKAQLKALFIEWKVKNQVSKIEGEIEELDQSTKHKEMILRKYKWNIQDVWDTFKRLTL
jgi:hypothetical protein